MGRKPHTATDPNQVWQIDLTPIPTLQEGWGYLFTVIETFDRTMLAPDLFGRFRTREALAALREALNKAFPEGAKGRGVRLVHDNGSQFASCRFREFVNSLEIEDIRTAYRHPKSPGILEAWHKTVNVGEVLPQGVRDPSTRYDIHQGLGGEVQLHSSSFRVGLCNTHGVSA